MPPTDTEEPTDPGLALPPDAEGPDPENPEGGSPDERAILEANFDDLPLVREVRELLVQRGYGEKDPMRIYLDVAAAFDRRCQLLTNRQVHMTAAMSDHMRELKDELANLSVLMEELRESNDRTGENHIALMDTFEKVLKVCGQFTPFLEKAAREIVVASSVIENRSVKALLFSYLSPALALCAGFLLALLFK